MKIKNLLAVTLATASTASLALGSSFTDSLDQPNQKPKIKI
jgi:hypothetical protein